MSDAPRWPGADGAPGLSFSDKATGELKLPANDPSTAPDVKQADSGAGPAAKIPGVVDGSLAPGAARVAAPAGGAAGSAAHSVPRGARPAQFVDHRALDDITRGSTPAAHQLRTADAAPDNGAGAASATRRTTVPPVQPHATRPEPHTARADDTPRKPVRGARRTRKARLRLNRIDPWSVMKTSFLFSIAFGVMTVAAVAVLWSVFAGSDTMTYINDLVNSVIADPQGNNKFDIQQFLSWQRVLGLTAVLAAIDVVIFTAVATLFAFLYNLSAIIMGGLEVTLAED